MQVEGDNNNKISWLNADQPGAIDLTVITVTWNSSKQLEALAKSLAASEGSIKAEWFVVDNASSDGSAEVAMKAFAQARIITNDHNAGFAKANNHAWELSRGRHLLLLNPDTTVEKDALQKTVEILDADKSIAVLGAKLLMADGQPVPQLRRFPTLLNQLCVLTKVAKVLPFTVSSYFGKDLDLHQAQDCDSLRGAYFAVSETAKRKLGMLDERYYLWFEEVDYCRAAKAAGLRVCYEPSIVAHDDLSSASFAQRESLWKNKVFSASMIAYFDKWHPHWQVVMIKYAAAYSYALTKLFVRFGKTSL